MSSLSVVFAGTPEFAVPALAALIGSPHRVLAAYTQPDRPAGRGQQVTASPVKRYALEQGIAVEQPATLRDADTLQRLKRWSADVIVVVAYGLLLPAEALAAARLGCINIHASLLPRWRGAAPIHRAILAGDAQTGVAIMRMEQGLDTGPILLERATVIGARDTAGTLHDRLASLGAQALLDVLQALASGVVSERAQPLQGVTYANKIRKEEARIDWSQPAAALDRQVRAFNPWPVAESSLGGQQLRIWEAEPVIARGAAKPGTVMASSEAGIDVATGSEWLRLTRVQLAGRKAVSAAEFLRAHRVDGAVLGE
jgi:methionyl-tRNA formyltransferase